MYQAIIVAAGKGERSGLSKNKILYLLNHKPIFMHSVDAFKKHGIDVILVINKDDEKEILTYYDGDYVYGGAYRSESVYNGLMASKARYVLIHDAARPFIKDEAIIEIKDKLKTYDAVLSCERVVDTIYKDLMVQNREAFLIGLTPQAFLREKYIACFNKDARLYTDDFSLYKSVYDEEVGLVYTQNKKITTKEDISNLMPSFKVGYSYDIHQTDNNRPLILGGITIPNDFGLLGHSDADVLLHAIAESIIGALGLGDLGTHFPDTDPKNKDLDSKQILSFAKGLAKEHGYTIENIDASIYAEKPKLMNYVPKRKQVISELLNITPSQLNIKAGTNEGQDSIGKSLSIAASSTCLLRRIT